MNADIFSLCHIPNS